MLFNSYVFVALFLPLVWCGYFLCNHFKLHKSAEVWLIIASFIFYGYEDYRLCILLTASILVNYGLHVWMLQERTSPGARKALMWSGVLVNFGVLFSFKYLMFVLDNVNRFLGTDFVIRNIVLPLGISFFTFQQVSFLIDSSKQGMERYTLREYALFVTFFPQLIAGPIVLHNETIPQFRNPENRRIQVQNMVEGLEYFFLGFAKKVLIADSFARICDAGWGDLTGLNSVSAFLTMLAFTLEIYFDFSGYCDMAIGLGRMFNIQIPLNFNAPYKAVTIDDFWKRWHMTLTRFLTTYLYIPLGGSRKGTLRTYVNILIVFTLSGVWHGAGWNFIIWGVLHGLMKLVYRLGKNLWDKLPKAFLWLCTFLFVNAAWMFFRAEYLGQPLTLFGQLVQGGIGGIHEDMLQAMTDGSILYSCISGLVQGPVLTVIGQILTYVWFAFCTWICVGWPTSHQWVQKPKSPKLYALEGILFAWALWGLSQVSKFIYFNF